MKKLICFLSFWIIICPLISNAQDNEIDPKAQSKSGGRIDQVNYYLKGDIVVFDITLKNTGQNNDEGYYLEGFYEIVNKEQTSRPVFFIEQNTANFYSGMIYLYSSNIRADYIRIDHSREGTARVTVLLKWRGKVIDKWSSYMNDF